MRISTYLSVAIKAEREKAAMIDMFGLSCLEQSNGPAGGKYRWYDRISQTAQRRLLAVAEKREKEIDRWREKWNAAVDLIGATDIGLEQENVANQGRIAELESAIWAAVNFAHERIAGGYGCPLCKEIGGFYDHDVYEHWAVCLLAEYEKLVGVARPQ